MQTLIGLILLGLAIGGYAVFRARPRRAERERYIREYAFPAGLLDRLSKKRPELTPEQLALVGLGLKQFFLTHLRSGHFVSMPSQVADDLWHEFILYTRNYEQFCRRAFGRFMHHTPAAVLGKEHQGNAGLRRAWWHACKLEGISPATPGRLPLLFALDARLNIADGFFYHPQCDDVQRTAAGGAIVYCGADFSSLAVDGTTKGFGDGGPGRKKKGDSGCGGGTSGCNSGCSSGCGGGCGGS